MSALHHAAMTKPFVRVLAWWTCLMAFPLGVGLTGCASHQRFDQSLGHRVDGPRTAERSDRQSTAQEMEDSRTAERVREALAASADYRYDEVKVTASSGVVQLNGFVHTGAQKNRAGGAAR